MHAYDPNFLCDLLDGLEAIPDSQWRAWLLEHDGAGGGSGSSERLQLGWLGFGQSEMLLLQLQNIPLCINLPPADLIWMT